MKTADELAAEGELCHLDGRWVVILHPAEECLAVAAQEPFLRSRFIPRDTDA